MPCMSMFDFDDFSALRLAAVQIERILQGSVFAMRSTTRVIIFYMFAWPLPQGFGAAALRDGDEPSCCAEVAGQAAMTVDFVKFDEGHCECEFCHQHEFALVCPKECQELAVYLKDEPLYNSSAEDMNHCLLHGGLPEGYGIVLGDGLLAVHRGAVFGTLEGGLTKNDKGVRSKERQHSVAEAADEDGSSLVQGHVTHSHRKWEDSPRRRVDPRKKWMHAPWRSKGKGKGKKGKSRRNATEDDDEVEVAEHEPASSSDARGSGSGGPLWATTDAAASSSSGARPLRTRVARRMELDQALNHR